MEENAKKESSKDNHANRRPPFTAVDWIIAVLSIALLIYLLLHMPVY